MALISSILLLAGFSLMSVAAQDFPLRDPLPGEVRPSWWWACWSRHIVVVDGTIRFEDEAVPDVSIKVTDRAAAEFLNEGNEQFQRKFSNFKIARIEVAKFVFASRGITIQDGRVEKIAKTGKGEIKVLVRLLSLDNGRQVGLGIETGRKGVFILDYGSMMPTIPMILAESIPPEKMEVCSKIFEHRKK